jgi:putative membrane protein
MIAPLLAHTPQVLPRAATEALPRAAGALRAVPPFSWTDWSIHWSTVYGMAALTLVYATLMFAARRRRGRWEHNDGWRWASFTASQVVLFFSLNGPLHDLSDYYLFSAHMVQHLLLIEVWAPLLLLALPGWMQAKLLDWGWAGRALAALTRPLPAFALFNVAFTIWHTPQLYDLMMRNHDVHIATHLLFMATAILLWWPVIQSAPGRKPLSAPGKMLYLALLGVPMMPVAGFISLADGLLYPWYASSPRVFDLSPHQDQQLGGLIMWVPGSAIFWIAMSAVYFRWALEQERREHEPVSVLPSRP